MGFESGTVSFRRFGVIGNSPATIDQELIDKVIEHRLIPDDLGMPAEMEYGWSGGRHVMDGRIDFGSNVFNEALSAALRIDTNKVPSSLVKAFRIMEEDAAAKDNPSGFASKLQKRNAKEAAQRKADEELRSGKFRRSKLVPFLWDVIGSTVLSSASNKSFEAMAELFERSFGLSLQPMSSGVIALQILEAQGKRRDYEDVTPTRFVVGPEGESQRPEYPWTAKGTAAKDFLGNEFLLWLWHQAFIHEGAIRTEKGEASVFLEQVLELDCAYGMTGRDTLRGDGVTRMPEAIDALRTGKVPRKVGLILEASGLQFSFKLAAESLAISGLKLPEVEEAESPRVVFEERVGMLRDFNASMDALFGAFLKVRMSSNWEGEVDGVRKWIAQMGRVAVNA